MDIAYLDPVDPTREFPYYGDSVKGECTSSCSGTQYGDPEIWECRNEC